MSVHARIRTVSGTSSGTAPPVTAAEAARAVPGGSRPARGGREFLAALAADPAVAAVRGDGRRNLLAVAAAYARHASRRHGTSRPGHDLVAAETGLELSTVKRHNRWLREHGYLGTVRPGSTPATRRGARPEAGNEAAVYCLAVPGRQRDLTAPPVSRRRKSLLREENPGAHARRAKPECPEERPSAWRGGTLGRIRLPALLAVAAAFAAAGWTPADLAYAVDHHPDGTPHWHTRQVRNPGGWARYRLSLWLQPDGTPVPSRSRQLADAAAAHRSCLTAQERYAPITAVAAQLRASGCYDSAADAGPAAPSAPAAPRAEVIAALRARLGTSSIPRRDHRCTAAEQAAQSRRARGAAA